MMRNKRVTCDHTQRLTSALSKSNILPPSGVAETKDLVVTVEHLWLLSNAPEMLIKGDMGINESMAQNWQEERAEALSLLQERDSVVNPAWISSVISDPVSGPLIASASTTCEVLVQLDSARFLVPTCLRTSLGLVILDRVHDGLLPECIDDVSEPVRGILGLTAIAARRENVLLLTVSDKPASRAAVSMLSEGTLRRIRSEAAINVELISSALSGASNTHKGLRTL